LFFAIAGDQNIIAIIADEALRCAATPAQKVVTSTTLEFLQRAFTANQGIGASCKITEARRIIAVEILIACQWRLDVKAAYQAIRPRAAIKGLARATATKQNVITGIAIKRLLRAAAADQAIIIRLTTKRLCRTFPAKDRVVIRPAINLISAATARKRIIALIPIDEIFAGSREAASHAGGISVRRDNVISDSAINKGHENYLRLRDIKYQKCE